MSDLSGCALAIMSSASVTDMLGSAIWLSSIARPDLIEAAVMAGLVLSSSFIILHQAWKEYCVGSHQAAMVEKCEQ